MSYQSEAALEAKLIKTLSANGYLPVKIANIKALELNFRKQLETHNGVTFSDDEFLRIRNHLDGGSVFEKAIKLRDRYDVTIFINGLPLIQIELKRRGGQVTEGSIIIQWC